MEYLQLLKLLVLLNQRALKSAIKSLKRLKRGLSS